MFVFFLTAKCLLTFSHYTRPHLEYGSYVYGKNKLGSPIYCLVYKFNVCFIRLENLVYQNNPFVIYTWAIINTTYNTQSTEYYKEIFLNIYHFPSTLVLLKYQDPFIEYAVFGSCLSCRALFNGLWISTSLPIQTRSVLELQICSNHSNIGQDRLNVALTMYKH